MKAVAGRLASSPRWQTILAVEPDTSVNAAYWPASVRRIGQERGGLGERMQRILAMPRPGPIVIVGTDIPAIRPRHIAAAFRALGNNDAVFGPAADGGFWLVGLRRTPKLLSIFSDVRWSGPDALSDTVANLKGWKVGYIAELDDVDTLQDYRGVKGWCGRCVLPVTSRAAH